MTQFNTITEIQNANAALGHCWFSQATLNFFSSQVEETVYGGRFFVTSERGPYQIERGYTVRVCYNSGLVDTIGEFNRMTRDEAVSEAKRLGAEETTNPNPKYQN